MYKLIQSERLYQQIVQQIEQSVVAGGLRVGDRLPPERELGDRFGVSRTAVREAVKALREKGLVQTQPGRGTFITNGTSRAVRNSLDLAVRVGHSHGSDHLVQVRAIFEPEVAALAAEHATAGEIAALRNAVAVMDSALENVDTFIEADLGFHRTLAEATRNDIIPILIDSIVDLLREQRKGIFFTPGGPQRGQIHHRRILQAVIRHNSTAARTAMRDHLKQISEDSVPRTRVRRHARA
ncbi:MAG: FadR family transcriptional regulator [Chloroflexi bacterium]|nr:FadR family transcriptional regulator [Chloroflexota bacterium]